MTPVEALSRLRAGFDAGCSKPSDWRIRQLKGIRRMLTERHREFEQALSDDLGKPASEAWLTEIGFTTAEITHTLKHLRSWLKPQRVPVPAALAPASASVVREPLGVVLVIAPWNYPLQLLLTPVAGALAAGNVVLAKPSELAPATSAALARWIPEYLDDNAVRVVEGGIAETTALLTERFDHVFYTGNSDVGRIVMTAAAKHLTPVTLELGGKSPVYVDESVDIDAAARRIAWGKFMNAGQTCVAPDYVLATEAVSGRLVPALRAAIEELFGTDPGTSADYGRIIDERHYHRLDQLLTTVDPVIGGTRDSARRYIAPTVVAKIAADAPLMQEEIFGPILALVTIADANAAVSFIKNREKPLALYIFSENDAVRKMFTTETSSGALVFGAPAVHLMVPGLPFGGVGGSGTGNYHGKHSIETFSHAKAVLSKPLKPNTLGVVYPPFTRAKDLVIRKFIAPTRK